MSYQEAHDQFIEYIGQITEGEGHPRIAGRIFGLLLLTPGELTLDQIAEALHVSRASVSTDARRLAECGLLERVTRRGDRRDYYRISSDHYIHMMERRIAALERLRQIFTAGLDLEGLPGEVEERLQHCAEAHDWLAERAAQDLKEFRRQFGPPSSPLGSASATPSTKIS